MFKLYILYGRCFVCSRAHNQTYWIKTLNFHFKLDLQQYGLFTFICLKNFVLINTTCYSGQNSFAATPTKIKLNFGDSDDFLHVSNTYIIL